MNQPLLLCAAALWAMTACSGSASREKPPAPLGPSDAGVAATPPIDASTAPVVTAAAEPEFWKKGDAACPDGGKLVGAGTTSVFCASPTGEIHGPSVRFGDKGQILELSMWSHGKREGLTTNFSLEGVTIYQATMRQNNQHGTVSRYHANGKKASEGTWRDGRPDGTFRAWDPGGKEIGSFTMKNGTGTLVEWHDNGQKAYEQPMENGEAHGTIVHWFPSGAKQSESRYSHGKAVGATTSWDEQGRLVSKGQYKNDEQEGDWTFYDPASGQVVRVDRYAAGKQLASIDYQDGKPLSAPLPPQGACTSDEGAAGAFEKQSGQKLDDEHPCIHHAQHFPGLVLFGSFAYDRGCAGIGALLDCKLVKGVDAGRMLDRAGWAAAKGPRRETMAMNYLREVELAWEGGMTDEPAAPVVVQEKDGGVTITAWIAEPAGMRRETTRHLTEFRFAARGALTSRVLKSETK